MTAQSFDRIQVLRSGYEQNQLASIFSQHYAAARTRIHLDGGGLLPFEPPEPVICPCRLMGTARVIEARFGINGFLVMVPPCGHLIRLELNRKPGIQGASFGDLSANEGSMRHVIAAHRYSMVERMMRFGFARAPANYLKPEHMIREGLYGILARRCGFTDLTSRLCYLFECMAREDPICLWVDPDVAEAAVNSATPVERLAETHWYQKRCVFFLPTGSLTGPKGEICSVLGYSLIQPGIYDLLDRFKSFVVYEPRVFIWVNAPAEHRSFLLDLRIADWDQQPVMPEGLANSAFYQRALNLVLVLNTLGLSPQARIEETQIQTRGPTKKERRKGRDLPRKLINCPWLRFARRPRTVVTHERTGRRMRPHNKPGWFQRYHSRHGTAWHYRPPQRANAHLETDLDKA